MKRIISFKQALAAGLLLLMVLPSNAQLSLQRCQELARNNYPLIKQVDLINQSEQYSLSNVGKNWLPQISVSVRATYQSEATKINIPQLGLNMALPNDQYQAVLEASQLLWDAGATAAQRKLAKAGSAVEKNKLEVDLYTLKDRVSQLFFGLLLIDEQLAQQQMLDAELRVNYDKVKALIQSGVASLTDLDAISVERLSNQQRMIEFKANHTAYREMLNALIGYPLSDTTALLKPALSQSIYQTDQVYRPELSLLNGQSEVLLEQENLVKAGNLPKLGLFVQGGYGNPGLNMFKEGFSGYFLGGLRLSWNLSSFYTRGNDLNKLRNTMNQLAVQRETFLFNNQLSIARQLNEQNKIKQQIDQDKEIVRLRNNLKQASMVKVEQGVLSVTDLLRDINAENSAIIQKQAHEIQLLMAESAMDFLVNPVKE